MKEKHHASTKKHKKHKKQKRKKEIRSKSSDSDSSEEDVMEWVEAPAPQKDSPKHDDWMNAESFVPTLAKEDMKAGSSRERKKEELAQQKIKEEAIHKARELNPHWKNEGSGLPQVEAKVENLSLPSTSVGDCGYAYLKKAYLRISEQSQKEGRSMEDIAVERWGSLNKLLDMLETAKARMREAGTAAPFSPAHHKNDRRRRSPHRFFKKPSHRDSSPSPERSFQFQKPKDHDRNRNKIGRYNSSDLKRSYAYDSNVIKEKESHLFYPKKTVSAREISSNSEQRFASPPRSHVPAWKKIKNHPEGEVKRSTHKDASVPKSWSSEMSPNPNERKTNTEEVPINSEDDLNKLAAKYLKADLMGDKALAFKLKAQLDEAREAFKDGDRDSGCRVSSRPQERVLLTKADSSGQHRPIQASREDAGFERRSGRKKTVNKYFDDGSKYSLKQMFEREKLTTAEDNLEMFLDVAAESKESAEDIETSGITRKASHKMSHGVQEEKDIGKAMQQHQKLSAALEKCEYCLDQPNMKRHLLITIREQVYLCIPNYQSLTKGHCLIVPKRHVPSLLNLDEDEWAEIEELKCLLRSLFRTQEKSLLCLETSMNFGRCPHAVLECIPVPEEDGDMAPLYFKKAILESEEEWAHNVKLVDLTKKGLRRSVPKNLPYFCVLFDPTVHAGYAHVIEDEKCFPRNFGKEVIGGMLDIDYNHLYKNRREDPLKKSNEALEFTDLLETFNVGSS